MKTVPISCCHLLLSIAVVGTACLWGCAEEEDIEVDPIAISAPTQDDPVATWELQYLPAIEAHMKAGRLDSVIVVCELGLEQDSTRILLYNLMASAYATQRRFDEAISALQTAVRLAPEFTEGWANLGGIHTRLSRFEEAIPYLEQAARLDADQVASHHRLGDAYLHTSQHDKAEVEIRTAMALLPDDATLSFLLGRAQLGLEQTEMALASFLLAGKLDPGFVDTHVRAATVASQLGQGAIADSCLALQTHLQNVGDGSSGVLETMQKLRGAIVNAPDVAVNHARLGGFFLYYDFPPEALVLFARATRLESYNTWLLNEIGGMLSRKGKGLAALDFFQRALAVDPEFGIALINTGGILNALGRSLEALPYFERALVLSPGDPGVRFFLGVTYLSLQRHDDAHQSLRQALVEVGDTNDELRQRIQDALAAIPE